VSPKPKFETVSALGAASWGSSAVWFTVGWKEFVEAEICCWVRTLSVEGIALKGESPNGSSKGCIKDKRFQIIIRIISKFQIIPYREPKRQHIINMLWIFSNIYSIQSVYLKMRSE